MTEEILEEKMPVDVEEPTSELVEDIEPSEPEKTAREISEEILADILKTEPSLAEYAEFTVDEYGNIFTHTKIDPLNFSLSKDLYNYKDTREYEHADIITNMFSQIYMDIKNNLPNGYAIDERDGTYTVRSNEEIKRLDYEALPEEEKARIAKENELNTLRIEYDDLMTEIRTEWDYKQLKYVRGDYTAEQWEEIKTEIRKRTDRIEELREAIKALSE